MRSRYSAYALGNAAYLLSTWHATTRPEALALEQGPTWVGLEVRSVTEEGDAGTVEFVARYVERGRLLALHETSRFVREGGRWFYVDGEIHPSDATSVGRNDACPCGSGRKFKRCCGAA
jgi:SEC-C motif-containing protein